MGGGDLNAKKAWHPNTMKNQERVWKAEQAAAEEKKRIMELQRERALERDREELEKLARDTRGSTNSASDSQLHWMYDKPDKKVQHEDYLLGKAIDKNFDQAGKVEQNEIPAVSRRVVGSSMLSVPGDLQVDLARKLREDPLLLVKERERAARAALLNNPVQRSRLTKLLREEQEQKKAKPEKKSKRKDKSLDDILAAKLNALGGEKGVNLEKLLASDDSSSDISTKERKKEKKKNKKKKKSKEKHNCDTDMTDDEIKNVKKSFKEKRKYLDDKESIETRNIYKYTDKKESHGSKHKYSDSSVTDMTDDEIKNVKKSKQKRKYLDDKESIETRDRYKYTDKKESHGSKYKYSDRDQTEDISRKRKKGSPERHQSKKYSHDSKDTKKRKEVYEHSSRESYEQNKTIGGNDKIRSEKKRLNDKEKAARLAEMVAAGAEREIERGQRVAKQRSEIAADEKAPRVPRSSSYNEARALPDSLENRIHSNRHNIQRDRRHMNENFARR